MGIYVLIPINVPKSKYNCETVMENFEEELRKVPFGNSQFQILKFICEEETAERSYRKTLLQLDMKLKTLKECEFRRKRKEVDVEEIELQLQGQPDIFEKKRLMINLEEAEWQLSQEMKLIEDCLIEIRTYEAAAELIKKDLPENFSRIKFEEKEFDYWRQKLGRQAQIEISARGTIDPGTMTAISQLGITVEQVGDTIQIKYQEPKLPIPFIEKGEA
jgi:hypothetical protein